MILSKAFATAHPALLGMTVNSFVCAAKAEAGVECPTQKETYLLISLYAICKFMADFIRYVVEIPFSNVSASAEVYIASMVYKHIQD